MSEIPEDIWGEAKKAWYEADGKIIAIDSQLVIAKAILDERSRCAKIAGDRAAIYRLKESKQDFAKEDHMNWWDALRHTAEAMEIVAEEIRG